MSRCIMMGMNMIMGSISIVRDLAFWLCKKDESCIGAEDGRREVLYMVLAWHGVHGVRQEKSCRVGTA